MISNFCPAVISPSNVASCGEHHHGVMCVFVCACMCVRVHVCVCVCVCAHIQWLSQPGLYHSMGCMWDVTHACAFDASSLVPHTSLFPTPLPHVPTSVPTVFCKAHTRTRAHTHTHTYTHTDSYLHPLSSPGAAWGACMHSPHQRPA